MENIKTIKLMFDNLTDSNYSNNTPMLNTQVLKTEMTSTKTMVINVLSSDKDTNMAGLNRFI
jgi:hypothetical protein